MLSFHIISQYAMRKINLKYTDHFVHRAREVCKLETQALGPVRKIDLSCEHYLSLEKKKNLIEHIKTQFLQFSIILSVRFLKF